MLATCLQSHCEDDSLNARTLRRLQRDSFEYFVREINLANGLVLDKTALNWPASIAAMGMALSVYPVGVERGFMERAAAARRTLQMLNFLAASEQSEDADASGYRGFYYHFLHMRSGRREWGCELSSIDTALLMAGVLLAGEYFDGSGAQETEIREKARALYERVDWAWMLNGQQTLCHGWRPERGFLPFHWQGYDEALLLYLLALGSPTHPIEPRCYDAWSKSYQWKRIYGIEFLYAGPLFIHQMSHIWCDLRGVQDPFMRAHGSDYFENSRRATLIQQQYAIENPHGFDHVGKWCWGVTASDGPGNQMRTIDGVQRVFYDYVARGAPHGPDDGTVAPWAVAASLPFAPEIVAPTIAHMKALPVHVPNPYGFKASFNPVFPSDAPESVGWVSPYHFGINEGPTVLMIENHRSGLIWSLMRRCGALRAGLKAAGFTGGWLS
ncbi:MAG: glucoamylase family protein [Steroidobacteraceae bacterium]|jgi:hypothetical protein